MPQTKKAKVDTAKPKGKAAKAAKPSAKASKAKPETKIAAKAAAKVPVKSGGKALAKPTSQVKASGAAAKNGVKSSGEKVTATKVIEKSKTALKKETTIKSDEVKFESLPASPVVAEKPVKAPKAPKIPKMSASAIAKAEKATDAANALSQKWGSLYKKAESIEAKPYNMRAVFEEKTAIIHKVLGWGYILANKNDRLEVLFKDGIKYLISNYKPA